MIAQRVVSEQDLEDALLSKGFEPTDTVIEVGRYWRHSGTGRHFAATFLVATLAALEMEGLRLADL